MKSAFFMALIILIVASKQLRGNSIDHRGKGGKLRCDDGQSGLHRVGSGG